MAEYADELFERLDSGAHIYFCGLKGMMPGIQDMLAKVRTRPPNPESLTFTVTSIVTLTLTLIAIPILIGVRGQGP